MNVRTLIAASAIALSSAVSALASDWPAPTGPVVLEVSGAIANHDQSGVAQLDVDMMRNLDWREVETYTSFTTGMQRFAGPTLASLLDAVGAQGSSMNATAINDYFVEIPVAHADQHDVILAVEMNGKRMRIRDKGPIWVVYPLSESEAAGKPFDTEMIWQMNRIEIIN